MPSRKRSTASSCARTYSSFFRLSSTLVDCFRPLDARIISVLRGQCLGDPEHLLVPYNSATFYKRYYAFLKRIGVRQLAPYCCRHPFETMLARNNVRPVDVQRAMRHARYKTTANTCTHLESVVSTN